jgi:nucleoside-specific outer membrane channel protein Tsx
MKKLTRSQLNKIANMHAAAVILATESMNAFNHLNDDEIAYLDEKFERMALNLLYGEKPIFNADAIVEFVRENCK